MLLRKKRKGQKVINFFHIKKVFILNLIAIQPIDIQDIKSKQSPLKVDLQVLINFTN